MTREEWERILKWTTVTAQAAAKWVEVETEEAIELAKSAKSAAEWVEAETQWAKVTEWTKLAAKAAKSVAELETENVRLKGGSNG